MTFGGVEVRWGRYENRLMMEARCNCFEDLDGRISVDLHRHFYQMLDCDGLTYQMMGDRLAVSLNKHYSSEFGTHVGRKQMEFHGVLAFQTNQDHIIFVLISKPQIGKTENLRPDI